MKQYTIKELMDEHRKKIYVARIEKAACLIGMPIKDVIVTEDGFNSLAGEELFRMRR